MTLSYINQYYGVLTMKNKVYILTEFGGSYEDKYENIIGVFSDLKVAKKYGKKAFKYLYDLDKKEEWQDFAGLIITESPLDNLTPLSAYKYYLKKSYYLTKVNGRWQS